MSTRHARVVIPAGQALSEVFDLKGYHIVAVELPSDAEWTSADLLPQVETKQNSGVYGDVINSSGSTIKFTNIGVIGGQRTKALLNAFGFSNVTGPGRARFRSANTGTESLNENQVAAQVIGVDLEPVFGGAFGT